ncbi:unnamed protein product [Gordionus sp. m RMFG-2023]
MKVSWNSSRIEKNLTGIIIELSHTHIDMRSLTQQITIKNPIETSVDLSNVTLNLEYSLAIRVLFTDYNNGLIWFAIANLNITSLTGFNPIITNCQLRNRSIYGVRNFRISVTKDERRTYNIKITFKAPKFLMTNNSILDYAIQLNSVRNKDAPYQIYTKFENEPMEQNELVIKDLDKDTTYFLYLLIGYAPFIYVADFSAWQIFRYRRSTPGIRRVDFKLAPRINNACVIHLGNGIYNISVTWDSSQIEKNFTGIIIELSPTHIDMSSLKQKITIENTRETSVDFGNVTLNLEYSVAIRVLFTDYNNNKLGNLPYAFHTVYIIAS